MALKQVAPGLTLGTVDSESVAGLTSRMGTHNQADNLLRQHRANWPRALRTALAWPDDEERTKALDHEEVHEALKGLTGRRAFFDGERDTLEGATVRGGAGNPLIVSVVFRRPSGRVAFGVLPYDGLTKSQAAYDEAKRKAEAAPAAAPAEPGESPEAAALVKAREEAEAAQLRADEEAAKRRAVEQQQAELADRIAALENPEPTPGYAELNAGDRKKLVEEGGIAEFGRRGLERIEEYERAQPNGGFKTVLDAVRDALASTPADA